MATPNVTMPDKQEILRQEEELERKNKWLYPTVIAVLILFFIVGFIYGLQSVLSMEGSFPPAVLPEARSEVPETNEDLIAYLNALCEHAKAEKPAISTNWRFWVEEDTVSVSGGDSLLDTLKYLADPVEEYMEDSVEDREAGFSEGIDGIFLAPELSVENIESFTCDYIFYKCISCGKESAEPLDHCEDCGSEYPYQMQYRDNYTFTIEVKPDEAVLDRLFYPDTASVEETVAPQLADVVVLSDVQTQIDRLYITVVVRRANDELLSVRYGKEVTASANAAFTGAYAALGSADFSSEFEDRKDYDLTWPALTLNTHSKVLEPKTSDNLLATLVCSDPTAFDAQWRSSDEAVVAVDEEGYLKAGKNPGKATVTASFDFNGKTYEDSCEIIVSVPVESMKLNKRHLTLSVGTEASLTAKVSPKNATTQTATFYSTDETVVAVSEDGVVTAVSAGTATVYALSDDGYYKSSCEVTVK